MRRTTLPVLAVAVVLLLSLTVSGVYGVWVYFVAPNPAESRMSAKLANIHYGTLYITNVEVSGGNYSSAAATKSADTDIQAELTLLSNASSNAVVSVTFYNSTDVSYYYDKTQTTASNNEGIVYTVGGIEQKQEILPYSYATLTVTFNYGNPSAVSKTQLLAGLHFNFVVDKDSIGTIVAKTAVDRFLEILNNIVAPDSYRTLETAMNNRGSLFNKASAVTYIGNVVGSSSADSSTIENLFGREFISMDLDGDGDTEPITMMVKREDLDNSTATGTSYTYTNMGRATTVHGVEMTLYITAEDLSSVRSNESVEVYAATFTIMPGQGEWKQIVPLMKGLASANNYSGVGSANSFNTDTWVSDEGNNIEYYVNRAMNPA